MGVGDWLIESCGWLWGFGWVVPPKNKKKKVSRTHRQEVDAEGRERRDERGPVLDGRVAGELRLHVWVDVSINHHVFIHKPHQPTLAHAP